MNTIANHRQAPSTLSPGSHIAGAIAAVAIIAGVSAMAGTASEHAVQTELASLNPAIRYVVLPSVEIVARRQSGEMAEANGCVAPADRI